MAIILMIGFAKPLLSIYLRMKEFLIYKWLFEEYKKWKKEKERAANKSRKLYFQEYHKKKYPQQKLESFQKINNPQ